MKHDLQRKEQERARCRGRYWSREPCRAEAMYWDVSNVMGRAVQEAVYWDVSNAVFWNVSHAVDRAVNNVMPRADAVADAINRAVSADPKHPALQDFL